MAKPPTPDSRPRVIDHQHRVALPPEVLRALGVGTGDYVAFEVSGDQVRLHRVRWVVDRG